MPGQHDQAVLVGRDERRQRRRQPRVREQRRLDVGAVAQVEHVAREHDDARAAALLDRPRHRSAHLAGDVGTRCS